MKKSYTATATKTGKYWHIEVPKVESVTQARSLDEADEMARDLISILTEEAPDSFEIELQVNLPQEAADARQKAEELRQKAVRDNADAAVYSRRSVAVLRTEGYSQKDIAATLGISRQRAAQLISEATQSPQVARKAASGKAGKTSHRSARTGKLATKASKGRSKVKQ